MIMSDPAADEMRAHVGELLSHKRDYRQEIRDLTAQYPYVVFYGCGMILSGIIDKWNAYIGRTIDLCCDSDGSKWGTCFGGARCISPHELMAIKDKCCVFVTIGDFRPVYRFLKDNEFPSVNQLYKYDLAASEFLAHHDPEDVTAKLCRAYELLEDRQSRRVFDAIVTRVLGDGSNIDVMVGVCESNQYFPPDIVKLSEHERLVDIGAFNGDTITDFIGRTERNFDRIFAFEVDAINFTALRETVRKMPEHDRVTIFNVGIWDTECDITYSIGQSNSTVGIGEGKGHLVPLDDVLQNEEVTFIKMDIEGAEPQALRGAKNIIRNQKPKLAICVYHDFTHLWEIPLYINSLVPGYKTYLRHHNNMEYETVCYAVFDPCQAGARP